MGSMPKVLAIKEEGTHPSAEGWLARFAEVRGIRSAEEGLRLYALHSDIVVIDGGMPNVPAAQLFQGIQKAMRKSLVVLVDLNVAPTELKKQFAGFARLARPPAPKPDVQRIARNLHLSQESLARILRVSTKTANSSRRSFTSMPALAASCSRGWRSWAGP